jgi:hypothetical protein
MSRYRTGTAVKLREPLRRSRWHKHGRVRLRRGARGRVNTSRRHWRKGLRYEVAFRQRRRPPQVVRSVSADKLVRLVSMRSAAWLVLAGALALVVLAPEAVWT